MIWPANRLFYMKLLKKFLEDRKYKKYEKEVTRDLRRQERKNERIERAKERALRTREMKDLRRFEKLADKEF